MQTYVPYPNPQDTAQILAHDDLVQQIRDVVKVLEIRHETVISLLASHPVVKMWEDHEVYLAHYGLIMADELLYNRPPQLAVAADAFNEITEKHSVLSYHLDMASSGEFEMTPPYWFNDPNLHRAHQSELLRKNPDAYVRYFPTVPMDIPNYWPVK